MSWDDEKIRKEREINRIMENEKNICCGLGFICAIVVIFISFSYPLFRELFVLWWETTTNIVALAILFVVWGFMTLAIIGIITGSAIVGSVIGVVIGDIVSYFLYYKKVFDLPELKIKKTIVKVEGIFLIILVLGCILLGENYYSYLCGVGVAMTLYKIAKMPLVAVSKRVMS